MSVSSLGMQYIADVQRTRRFGRTTMTTSKLWKKAPLAPVRVVKGARVLANLTGDAMPTGRVLNKPQPVDMAAALTRLQEKFNG